VVTATRSGAELNFARFGDFLSQALVDNSGDLDKDDQTSLLEAFLVASREVERSYREAGQLATEHALLDDNGDKKGTVATFYEGLEPGPKATSAIDGQQARGLHLIPSERERRLSPEVKTRRNAVEAQIRVLKKQKNQLDETQYYDQLEGLMLQLAEIYTGRTIPVSRPDSDRPATSSSPPAPPRPEPAGSR